MTDVPQLQYIQQDGVWFHKCLRCGYSVSRLSHGIPCPECKKVALLEEQTNAIKEQAKRADAEAKASAYERERERDREQARERHEAREHQEAYQRALEQIEDDLPGAKIGTGKHAIRIIATPGIHAPVFGDPGSTPSFTNAIRAPVFTESCDPDGKGLQRLMSKIEEEGRRKKHERRKDVGFFRYYVLFGWLDLWLGS